MILSAIICFLSLYISNTKKEIRNSSRILDDVESGVLDRRLYTHEEDITSDIALNLINQLVEINN